MKTKELFDGKCPYTGKNCESWNCATCEVEQAERRDMNEVSE